MFCSYSLKSFLVIFFNYMRISYQYKLLKFITSMVVKKYIYSDYSFFLKNENSKLISNIYNECKAFVDWFIAPSIVLLSEISFVLLLISFLLIVDVQSTLLIVLFFSTFGFLFIFFTKKKLNSWGKDRQMISERLIHSLNQIFDGIKTIKIFKKEKYFSNLFESYQNSVYLSLTKNDVISHLPRVMLEYLIIVILLLILFFGIREEQNLLTSIPLIGLYAGATFKLLPSISKILVSFQNLKFGSPSLNRVYNEVEKSKNFKEIDYKESNQKKDFQEIIFKDLMYKYSSGSDYVLNQVNLSITNGQFIGIIGESGSGKTTLLNIILGLLKPDNGYIYIDGKDCTKDFTLYRDWFSLSSQENFLFDNSIMQNITLENNIENIDYDRFRSSKNISELNPVIDKLKNKDKSMVGQNAILISGGEKQRISIARALYKKAKIIILDEFSSNLDEEIENKIIENLKYLKKNKTIIFVTHKKNILKICDITYKMKNGVLEKI